MRSASSPGSTIRARSEPSARNRKQFSATGPTVNMRTSTGLVLLAGAHLLALAAAPHHRVDEVAERDVEDEHEQAEDHSLQRPLAEDADHDGDDRGADQGAHDRAAPGRGQIGLLGGAAALLPGSGLGL